MKIDTGQNGSFCQSCGMPLEADSDSGTNADGSRNPRFCHFCYKDGMYTEPDITAARMVEKVVGIMKLMDLMPEEQVREAMQSFIPTLERWRQ
ncbi:MAG: zinc ribbon domain-containing protein [Deltaproteobacteria bacterium]|nr:zinc ribbon domain-containing protein [Deltaproteobacteria bacterium]